MEENQNNSIYIKAKKIRTNLLLFTEKYIKEKQKKENNSREILSLKNKNNFIIDSMSVNFEEFYIERNVEIITQQMEKQEKKIIPNLPPMSFFHESKKSVYILKNSPMLSTAESILEQKVLNNKKEFSEKKCRAISEKIVLLNNNLNGIDNDYEHINQNINNKNIKTFDGNNCFNCCKKNNLIGKKYLKNLSKYLGVIPHKKHKIVKHCLVKKLKKKKLNNKK
jgi:hypothetical protein